MRSVAAPLARAGLAVAAATAVACASMAAPPGGPEDRDPAEVVLIVPESGRVNFKRRAVDIRFNEVVSDRGTGAAALEQLVLISPRDGAPRVSYRRDAISVRPRSGWRPNTTYAVTLLPGVTDLRGNRSTETRTIVFSTGSAMSPFALRGRVFDWMAERPAPRAWVEAVSRDSVVYVAIADSAGLFTAGPLPAGEYTIKAFIDQNANRALDRGEAWDSVRARTTREGAATVLQLLAVPRDTVPPRIVSVSPIDSATLLVEFDRPLDIRQTITPALFAVARADSTRVPVHEAISRREFERREEANRAREDSAARGDTGRVARPRAERRPAIGRAEPPVRPATLPPVQQVVLRLAGRLVPGVSYRVTASGVRNLLGRPGTTSRVVQVPVAAAAPRDTTRPAPP